MGCVPVLEVGVGVREPRLVGAERVEHAGDPSRVGTQGSVMS
jgi:hypothetical protein